MENVPISDTNLLISKKLADDSEINDRYCQLYINYRCLLDRYLVNKFSLKEYDERIIDSGLKFLPVKRDAMDYYQYMSTMGLNYIYLRNNLYVEKLMEADIEKILSLSKAEIESPSQDILSLIENTYHDVISRAKNNNTISISCYGPDNDAYWFDSRELVFGIRQDDFGDNGLGEEEEWSDNNHEQNKFLNALIDEMSTKCSNISNQKVHVIRYTEFTVQKQVTLK